MLYYLTMLSIYVHIPFCRVKCKYCSFFVTPEQEVATNKIYQLKKIYDNILQNQLAQRKSVFPDEQIRTIYIGGGTPFQLGTEPLIQLVETLFTTRDCTYLEEITIELNPDPLEEVEAFVKACNQRRAHLYRLRRSFGIQSFDDHRLEHAGRGYSFDQLPNFFRTLYNSKQPHVCYNADFIAFGQHADLISHTVKSKLFLPRGQAQRTFFEKLLSSHCLDSVSLYTLELFPGSDRYNTQKQIHSPMHAMRTDDDSIAEEFHRLSTIVQQYGYRRHEISNFSLPGKRSLHNSVYRTLDSYIGIGIHASSMLTRQTLEGSTHLPPLLRESMKNDSKGVRFSSPKQRKKIEAEQFIAEESITMLDTNAWLTEELMLKLRTDQRITDRSRYTDVMEKNRKDILASRRANGYIIDEEQGRQMTDTGRNVYNTLITDLLRF